MLNKYPTLFTPTMRSDSWLGRLESRISSSDFSTLFRGDKNDRQIHDTSTNGNDTPRRDWAERPQSVAPRTLRPERILFSPRDVPGLSEADEQLPRGGGAAGLRSFVFPSMSCPSCQSTLQSDTTFRLSITATSSAAQLLQDLISKVGILSCATCRSTALCVGCEKSVSLLRSQILPCGCSNSRFILCYFALTTLDREKAAQRDHWTSPQGFFQRIMISFEPDEEICTTTAVSSYRFDTGTVSPRIQPIVPPVSIGDKRLMICIELLIRIISSPDGHSTQADQCPRPELRALFISSEIPIVFGSLWSTNDFDYTREHFQLIMCGLRLVKLLCQNETTLSLITDPLPARRSSSGLHLLLDQGSPLSWIPRRNSHSGVERSDQVEYQRPLQTILRSMVRKLRHFSLECQSCPAASHNAEFSFNNSALAEDLIFETEQLGRDIEQAVRNKSSRSSCTDDDLLGPVETAQHLRALCDGQLYWSSIW